MKLAWVERMNGKWGARRLSADALIVRGPASTHLARRSLGAKRAVRLFPASPTNTRPRHRVFRPLDGGTGIAEQPRHVLDRLLRPATSWSHLHWPMTRCETLVAPDGTRVDEMRFRSAIGRTQPRQACRTDELGTPSFGADKYGDGPRCPWKSSSLRRRPRRFGPTSIRTSTSEFTSQHGVFLDDDDRTFHVHARATSFMGTEAGPKRTSRRPVQRGDTDLDPSLRRPHDDVPRSSRDLRVGRTADR